jgi:outer membrane protein assembly factor BamB
VAAAVTPSGRAVFRSVREAVGIEHAAPALIALPGGGRLLVVGSAGESTWLVEPNGAKRDLGRLSDAAWSPHGLFIAATRGDELDAIDARGTIRWSLTRRAPRWPRWTGSRVDTRIAYVAADGLRVVAGDGTGDRLLDRGATLAPAWDPARARQFDLAYAVRGAIVLRRDDGNLVWRRPVNARPLALAWSSDGRFLAVVSRAHVLVLDGLGRLQRTLAIPGGSVIDAAFAPGSARLAVAFREGARSEVRVTDVRAAAPGKLVLAGPGAFGQLAWGPGGEWLLVTWPAADQWVFLRGGTAHAVGRIGAQFGARPASLQVAGGWCCPS